MPTRFLWLAFTNAAVLTIGPWIVLGCISRSLSVLALVLLQAIPVVLLVVNVVLCSKAAGSAKRGIGVATAIGGASFALASFAQWYFLLSAHSPGAFSVPLSRADALYLTISTATTTGMGDIRPASIAARILAMAEMVSSLAFGVISLGLIVQRLILQTDSKRSPRSRRPRSRYR